MNVDVLSQEAVGAWSVCHSAGHDTTCKLGIYDDSATGSNPDAAGLAGLEPGHLIAFSDDSGSESAYAARTGTWAIQRGPALCASSDAYSSDMNCDGIAEKAVWRGSTGTWYIRFSGSNELLVEQWGLPGDVPIFGDYDGDRIADLAVWRPSNGTWYVKTSTSLFDSSQAVAQQFGLPGDVPVRGDYDGDGVLDYAVWRPTEGNWYVLQSASDEAVVEQWGLPGDVALVGSKAAQ